MVPSKTINLYRMDQIILNRNVKNWVEACQFLKSAEIKDQLDQEEWTAIEGLSNLWNKRYVQDEVEDTAREFIDILKKCENFHPNNLDIKTYSKQLTGVARDMFTNDEATYEEFKGKLLEKFHKKRSEQKKQAPENNKTSKDPVVDPIIINRYVTNFLDAYLFLSNPRIQQQLSEQEVKSIEAIFSVLVNNQINQDDKKLLENAVSFLKGTENLHPNNLDIKTNSKQLTGVAREVGFCDAVVFAAFAKLLKTKLAEFEQKREEQNIPRIEIKCVEFANFNNDNKIIDDYGIPMRVGLYYLTPRMTIDTNFYLSNQVFHIIILDSKGEIFDEYDIKNINLSGSKVYELTGWGNSRGTFFKQPGDFTYCVSYQNAELIRVPLKIYPSLQANAPIEITNVVFANYSNSGQVLNDYTSALPGGVQFLTPKLTLSTKHVGIITVNITFNSWAGTTMKHSCNIFVNGSGEYECIGYGNANGTCYKDGGDWTVTFDGAFITTKSVNVVIGIPDESKKFDELFTISSSSEDGESKRGTFFAKFGRIFKKSSSVLPHYQAGTSYSVQDDDTPSGSWWTRLDNKVRRFGNWYDGIYSALTSAVAILFLGGGLLYLVVLVISTFIQDGLGMGILSLVLSCIVGYIGFYVISFIIVIFGIAFWLFRWVVWNIYTLIAFLIVVGLIMFA